MEQSLPIINYSLVCIAGGQRGVDDAPVAGRVRNRWRTAGGAAEA